MQAANGALAKKQFPSSAKESPGVSEIECNGLLEKVRRPASEAFSPAPVVAASLLAGVGIGSNAGLLFFHF
jgi:hypothetical protein